MKRLLRSIGVVKEVATKKYHLDEKDNLKLYKRTGNPSLTDSPFSSDKKKEATEKFVPYLNECLSYINAVLDDDEESKLNRYLAEVIGNAEEHSGNKLWTMVSYLDAKDRNNLYCEIVIKNIGKTIYNTFIDKIEESLVNNRRIQYVDKHIANFTDEQLTLVYSMQQNASSKLDEDITRGQGTKYLINLFHHLSDECNRINHSNNITGIVRPQMFVLSGSSMLKFDGTYRDSKDEKGKMIYSFNASNDLSVAPDAKYVKSLQNGVEFAGTIIYIRFALYKSGLRSSDEHE